MKIQYEGRMIEGTPEEIYSLMRLIDTETEETRQPKTTPAVIIQTQDKPAKSKIRRKNGWRKAETESLREQYARGIPIKDITIPGRSQSAIQNRAHRLGLPSKLSTYISRSSQAQLRYKRHRDERIKAIMKADPSTSWEKALAIFKQEYHSRFRSKKKKVDPTMTSLWGNRQMHSNMLTCLEHMVINGNTISQQDGKSAFFITEGTYSWERFKTWILMNCEALETKLRTLSKNPNGHIVIENGMIRWK